MPEPTVPPAQPEAIAPVEEVISDIPLTPQEVFGEAARRGASDVHVAVGAPLQFRIDGELRIVSKSAITHEQAEAFIRATVTKPQWERFEQDWELDCSYSLQGGQRLRVNCHRERNNVGLVARIIPAEIPTLESLELRELAEGLRTLSSGIVLFTGPTGEGKSTSLAAIIQYLRTSRKAHVVTLEDPIEFVFPPGAGVVRQREFGTDFKSFPEGLKRVLRQDPDIVLVGEMRDPETIAAALTLAETGHLTFGTLHTPNTIQSIDRIVDVCPPNQQQQVRNQLSLSLKLVVAQRLVRRKGGGRVALREILVTTPAVSNIIRDNRAQELTTVLQTGSNYGMRTFAKDAERLLKAGVIEPSVAEWYLH